MHTACRGLPRTSPAFSRLKAARRRPYKNDTLDSGSLEVIVWNLDVWKLGADSLQASRSCISWQIGGGDYAWAGGLQL